MQTGGLASPPESQFNSPNVAAAAMSASESNVSKFSPSQFLRLDSLRDDLDSRNGDDGMGEKLPPLFLNANNLHIEKEREHSEELETRIEDNVTHQDVDRTVDVGDVNMGEKLPPPLFVNPAELEPSMQDIVTDQDVDRTVNVGSGLTPELRKSASLSSLSSMSEGGDRNPAGHSENGERGDRVRGVDEEATLAINVKPKEPRPVSKTDEEARERVDEDSPMVGVDSDVGLERKQPLSCSMVVDEEPPGDGVLSKRILSYSGSDEESLPADGAADSKKGYRVVEAEDPMSGDESKEASLDSVLSVHLDAPFEPRRSLRNAPTKNNPSLRIIVPRKLSRSRRKPAPDKDEVLPQACIQIISLNKG